MSKETQKLEGQEAWNQWNDKFNIDDLDLDNIDLETALDALKSLNWEYKDYRTNSSKWVEKLNKKIKELQGDEGKPPAKETPKDKPEDNDEDDQEDEETPDEPTPEAIFNEALSQIPEALRGEVENAYKTLAWEWEVTPERMQVLFDSSIKLVNADKQEKIPVFGANFWNVATNSKEKQDKALYDETAKFLEDFDE